MAGINLPALASAFVRFLQRENPRPSFARRHRLRRRHGAGFRRFDHGHGFRRHGNGSGPRHRSGLGGRRRPFVLNRRRHGNDHQAPAPPTGHNIHNVAEVAQAAPVAPPSQPAPLPPVFNILPMDWLLGGPAAPFLGEEDDFVAALAPPPYYQQQGYQAYFPGTIFNPPTPTPSDEDPDHFMPPGYGPVPGLESSPPAEETDAPSAATSFAFDLNVKDELEDEETFVAAPTTPAPPPASPSAPPAPAALAASPPPSPSPEARRLLRRFAAAMASRQHGFRTGAWDPASLGFSNGVECGGSYSRRH